jgi:hypothetical protein
MLGDPGMNRKIRIDILAILRGAIKILRKGDASALRELSDHTVHNASIFQDHYSVTIAVIIYALSKTVDRMAKVEPKIIEQLLTAREHLKANAMEDFDKDLQELVQTISHCDSQMPKYVHQVMSEARIKKASRIYEHGISLAQTARLLGTTQWELMKYVGQTTISDNFAEGISAKSRLEFARGLFR